MPNRLIEEQSLYLLQHAHNPVDWYPFGDLAFNTARQQQKPILVSIGYAACHWCHVMERESFEDATVAAYMNEHFVCIKVDREEHPEVDSVYMDAVQAITGQGGWPLNVFVTSDRVPFYGGTYFPPQEAYKRPSWMHVLQRISEIWVNQQDEIITQTDQMVAFLNKNNERISSLQHQSFDDHITLDINKSILGHADKEYGGFGNAPKFPSSMAIKFLLEHFYETGNAASLQHALTSLDAMANGGIYDHLGGGFARYTTDRVWLVPHFEKMLYDNALLIMAYAPAYTLTYKPAYKQVITETIDFVTRELMGRIGGFYAALDADSEGVEGKFYTWDYEEIAQIAQEDMPIIQAYYGLKKEGNWEEVNILHRPKNHEILAQELNIDEEVLTKKIQHFNKELWNLRITRVRPATDDKFILSWNALMNWALIQAARSLKKMEYAQMAQIHANWMRDQFTVGNELKHVAKNGVVKVAAHLDDYAYLIRSYIELGAYTGDEQWLLQAHRYLVHVIERFSVEDGFFYYTDEQHQEIPIRKVDIYDGALPSPNAIMAENLWLMGHIMEESTYTKRAIMMMEKMAVQCKRAGSSFGYWSMLIQRKVEGLKLVVIAGVNREKARGELYSVYIPNAFMLICAQKLSEIPLLKNKFSEENIHIFVCTENECLSPVISVDKAFDVIGVKRNAVHI